MTDLGIFLAPVAGLNPAGVELRNDGRFHAIERLLEPTSRSVRVAQVENGGSGAIDVDWPQIADKSAELAAEGRDLRLLVIVTRALANAEGFAGLAKGLDILTQTITLHWDNLHPALRESPSGRDAATRRVNALYQLENSENGLLCDIEFTPIIVLPVIGAITGRDLANGMQSTQAVLASAPGLSEKEKSALLAEHEARANRVRNGVRAYAKEQPAALAALIESIDQAQKALTALEIAINLHVSENGVGVKFEKLGVFLGRILQSLTAIQDLAGQRAVIAAGGSTMTNDTAPTLNGTTQLANGPASYATTSTAGVLLPGGINSRQDVVRCLDMIIDFYARIEPSSPIPHLAQRMRKMVPMNFVQLMEEIAPSGLKEFRSLAGSVEGKSQ